MDAIKVASICMTSTNDKKRNIESAVALVRQAADAGAQWVQLPEVFAFHGGYDQIYDMAEFENGELNSLLSSLARELNICLFAGSVGERPEPSLADKDLKNRDGHKRVYNTSYVFDRQGKQVAKYRKTHLFNLYDEAKQPLYCESDGFIAGSSSTRFELDGFKVGVAICYDLRFSGFFANLVKKEPLDVIVIPSAFTHKTGEAHWELLLRARAVECQSYVYAANQTGTHGVGKISYGHSMVIDPWGDVLANTGPNIGFAIAEISHERIRQVRGRLPALDNRRPELY